MNAKRDGGIVLLDINEAPSTLRDPKRRKTTNLTADDKKTNNPDAPESVSPSIGSTPTAVSSATNSAAINSTTPPALVLGHKSGVSETELPSASKSLMPIDDPYDISRELAQTESGRSGMSAVGVSGVTASKSTPDYAAGLVGSTNSPHAVNRYGTIHDSSGPLKSSGISLLSNSGSNTSSEMFPKTSAALSLPKDSNTSNAANGSNSYNSTDISNPLSTGLSNQNFFKPTQSQQQLPVQQSQPVQPLSQQQTLLQQQQTSNLYRSFANQYTASQQKMVQGQGMTDQSTPTSPINTMYGVIRPQQPLVQPVQQQQPQPQQQQQQPQQRLMYNPVNSSILSQQVQARPTGQSVIHSNPQQQHNQQLQFEMSLQQQQMQQQQAQQQQQQQPRPFGMYGQMNQIAKNQVQQVQQPHADAPQIHPQNQRVLIAREITQQATAIFNASNCLTRPEKALILGFMAGTQPNPAPQMGPICMIRYLEKVEERQTATGTVTVVIEEHFQMNFNTNEWQTVQSVRQADPSYKLPSQDHSGNQTRIVVLDPNQQHHFITIASGRAQQPVLVGNVQGAQNQGQQQQQMQHGQLMPGQQVPNVAGSQFMRA